MGKQIERVLSVERVEDLIAVFGSFDENTKRIEEALDVKIINRGTDLKVAGDEENVDKAIRTLEGLLALSAKGETITSACPSTDKIAAFTACPAWMEVRLPLKESIAITTRI